jgi:hypothetical protein
MLAQDGASMLYGSWKLISWKIQIVGDSSPPAEPWGPNPKGYLILLPNGRMMAHLSAPNRKRATNDAESAALLNTMNAYTGTYKIDGNKWTTIVDLHHNEVFIETPQVRFFKVDGDKLLIRSPEQLSAAFPGKMVTGTLEWVRER